MPLPDGLLADLLADPFGALTTVLLYHVLGVEVFSSDLSDGQTATTLQGEDITVTIDGTDVFINQAQVIVPDLDADNGVVHVIDSVLVPMALSVDILNAKEHGILIAPNPAQDYFNIQFAQGWQDNAQLQLYDASGRIVIQGDIVMGNQDFDISELNTGLYLVRINTPTAIYYDKLIISK